MKKILIIIFLYNFISYGQNLPELEYKSSENITGGFFDFILIMNSNGKFELKLTTSKNISVSEKGNLYESITKTVLGNWSLKNNIIHCSFNESQTQIDSCFKNTFIENLLTKPIILFSPKLDTAYIYGIPCKKF